MLQTILAKLNNLENRIGAIEQSTKKAHSSQCNANIIKKVRPLTLTNKKTPLKTNE